jgi:SAM-dependent methyltransferase
LLYIIGGEDETMNSAQAMQRAQEAPPQEVMLQLFSGLWISQAIHVAAKLGLPDLVGNQPKTIAELAYASNTHAPSLYRLLRGLASVGVFTEVENGQYASTPLSETLRKDAPGSLRGFAIAGLGQEHYKAWGNLLHSVQTGDIAFDNFFGQSLWEYYAWHPEESAVFNDAMTGWTESVNAALIAAYDFSGYDKVVDIGGGHGALLAAILKTNPKMHGVLFDLPQVAEGAAARLSAEGVRGRCKIDGGDFFQAVSTGGDAYVMKFIIHDWEDEKSIKIMKNIHRAMADGGKLILLEQIVPAGNGPSPAKWMDLNMLVMTGGCERTEMEFAELFAAAGFKLNRVVPTDSPFYVIEAIRV